MTDERSLRHAIHLVETSPLFDADWYLARYRDVPLLGMSPAEHYVRLGARLLRDPGPGFCTEYYLATYPDLAKATMNPLVHFIAHGQAEGRKAMAHTPAPAEQSYSPEQLALVAGRFDATWYRAQYDVGDVDPFQHFMSEGWRAGHDPNEEFSTRYYLRRYPDIAKSGMNPFVHYVLHGRAENRQAVEYRKRLLRTVYAPKVSVIVPNYNHGRFLAQRIDSILAQSYRNFDVLLLDDCSSDDSREVIADYCRRYPGVVRSVLNEENAGNVFRQWRKGLEAVDGELAWICESDDFCDPDFLASLVPALQDRSVNIAFGRIQFADREGNFQQGLDQYREGAEPGIWKQPVVRPAREWFANGFGVNNVIANVGGCIFRRQELSDAVWKQAEGYRILGDWFLYCHLAGGGQIAYEPGALAYFRQHGGNTSVKSFTTPGYYEEHQRLMTLLKERWEIPDATVRNFIGKIAHQYRHFKVADTHGDMAQYVDEGALLAQRRSKPHILVAFLGFTPGGGEVFPIHLANALRAAGALVSVLVCQGDQANPDMVALLDPGIAVYDAGQVYEMGPDAFLRQTGVTLVHSHMVMAEMVFFASQDAPVLHIPYLVTLHGSYEACEVPAELVSRFAGRVTHWVYTTDRNLEPFEGLDLPADRFTKMANGMPIDERPFPRTRADLGIPDDAMVFTLVARGIQRKGWRASIDAFLQLRDRHPGRKVHLLLCGDGEEADRHATRHGNDPDITFLGYQSRISGLYRITDCAIVPTRYAGESFPLCLIQSLQVGTPVIASKVGEIERMIGDRDEPCGILIDNERDTALFTGLLCDAMSEMLDDAFRAKCAHAAAVRGHDFEIDVVAGEYTELYRKLLGCGSHAEEET